MNSTNKWLLTDEEKDKFIAKEVIKRFLFHVQLLHEVLDISSLSFIKNFGGVDFILLFVSASKLFLDFVSGKTKRSKYLHQPL